MMQINYFLPNVDISRMKIAYKIGNFLAIIPSYDFERSTIIHPKRDKIWSIFVSILLSFGWMYSMETIDKIIHPTIANTLEVINGLSTISYVISLVVISNFFVPKKWIIMTNNLQQIDTYLFNKNHKQMFKYFYLHSFIGFIFLFPYYFYVIKKFSLYFGTSVQGRNILLPIFFFWEISVGIFIINLIYTFKIRYNYLHSFLEHNLNGIAFMLALKKFETILKLLSDCIECFNQIFGWSLIFLICNNAGAILWQLYEICRSNSNGDLQPLVYACFWLTFIFKTVVLLTIVFGSDALNVENYKLELHCYQIRSTITKKCSREELLALGKVCKKYHCKINAANFVDIEKRTLLRVLASIVTYLIVLLQLSK